MLRATALKRTGDWSGVAADTVVLDFDGRHRRRLAMTGVGGLEFLLDLAEAEALWRDREVPFRRAGRRIYVPGDHAFGALICLSDG